MSHEINLLTGVDLNKLNDDQKFAFTLIMDRLHTYMINEEEVEPLKLVVSGMAGSGKSFLINGCLQSAHFLGTTQLYS